MGTKIENVARRAGVSTCTVSHVLHQSRPVRPETRLRVLQAVAELEYRPNRIASGLKTSRTFTVGLLVSDIRLPSVGSLVTGAEGALVTCGYSPILCCTHLVPAAELNALHTLIDMCVDGLLAVGCSETFVARLSEVRDFPIVLAHCRTESGLCDWVDVDDHRGVYTATRHLLSNGHRRIAFVGRPRPMAMFNARRDGYRQALTDCGIPVDESLVYATEPGDQVSTALDSILGHSERATAIVAAHALITFQIYAGIKERGISIPRDLAMVGMGDDPWTKLVDPPLTTIAIPSETVGHVAATLLVGRLDGTRRDEPQEVMVEASLVVRSSSGEHTLEADGLEPKASAKQN